MQRVGERGANGLGSELVLRVEATSEASPQAIYEVLSDPRTHLRWAGEQQKPTTRLVSVEAPEGRAVVGTEFRTTGLDPMGTFSDRSVVTEAAPGKAFEFVTEAELTTKKGRRVDWTVVHRYVLDGTTGGTGIGYTVRIVRISELTGMLAMFKVPGLRALALKASTGVAKRGVRNLARAAE
jgi:uncharacterized protein YndB with AHSA1/START domain